MGRKAPSLQHELILRVLPAIKNNRTGTAYKRNIKRFGRWAKEQGYKRAEQITVEVIQKYEQHLELNPKQYSPSTIHAYLAPVCIAAGVRMDEIRKPRRTAGSITRGRRRESDGQVLVQNRQGDRQEKSEKFARLVTFQRAVGIRRAELGRLTGKDIVTYKNGLFVRVRKGKGGKEQLQYILPKDKSVVLETFAGISADERIFSAEEMNNKINLHRLRAQHGRECYEYYVRLIEKKEGSADSLRRKLLWRWEKGHERLHTSDPEAWKRQRVRFIADCDERPYKIRGDNAAKAQAFGIPTELNRLALMCVSVYHLSHWRIDVTVTNYIIG